jgi:tetratricopeptide (TPR) repeat protein
LALTLSHCLIWQKNEPFRFVTETLLRKFDIHIMAQKKLNISREELEHDEVLDFFDHAYFYLKTNFNKILIVILLCFAAYSVTVLLHQGKERNLRAASNDFFAAIQLYNKTLVQHNWGTQERAEGMAKVVNQTDSILEQYETTELGRATLFLKGNAYYFAGDNIGQTDNTKDAIGIFEKYAARAEKEGDSFEQAAALLALGYAHENLHLLIMPSNQEEAAAELNIAAEYYGRILNLQDIGFLRYEALNAQGRLLDYLGKTDEAIEVYKQVVSQSFRAPKEVNEDSPQREKVMFALRMMANQFTAGNSAAIALTRLGVKSEDILEEVQTAE